METQPNQIITRKHLKNFFLLLFSSTLFSQVGINTAYPQAVLDVTSSSSGILIPRLASPESNVIIPIAGMVIYDTNYKTIRYFDGVNWSTVLSSQNLTTANEGVVKLNSGNGIKPTFLFRNSGGSSLNLYQNINYTYPLSYSAFPTSSWPENMNTHTDVDFYDSSTGKFLENPIMGQVHLWRVIVDYTNKNNGSIANISIKLSNPLSTFFIEQTMIAPNGVSSGNVSFYLITIGDSASIGIGKGYSLQIKSDAPLDAVINSVTRISHAKD